MVLAEAPLNQRAPHGRVRMGGVDKSHGPGWAWWPMIQATTSTEGTCQFTHQELWEVREYGTEP